MTETQAPPAAPPETPPAAGPPATPPVEPPAQTPESVDALPDFAQKMIRELRAEAAANRTKATTEATQRQETMDAIAKALGLKGDDDPAAAAKTAAEERDAARAEALSVKQENAVLRMATKHGANPEALTDSRSFMRQLEAIDPADAEFAAKVEAAITAAVEANPSLKAPGAPATPARSGAPVGGGAAVPGQLRKEDLKDMTPDQINEAREAGLLNSLLGITK